MGMIVMVVDMEVDTVEGMEEVMVGMVAAEVTEEVVAGADSVEVVEVEGFHEVGDLGVVGEVDDDQTWSSIPNMSSFENSSSAGSATTRPTRR